jgi:hypothetical protein
MTYMNELLVCHVWSVNGGWSKWAIAHPGFGRIEGPVGQQRRTALLLVHLALDIYLYISITGLIELLGKYCVSKLSQYR